MLGAFAVEKVHPGCGLLCMCTAVKVGQVAVLQVQQACQGEGHVGGGLLLWGEWGYTQSAGWSCIAQPARGVCRQRQNS